MWWFGWKYFWVWMVGVSRIKKKRLNMVSWKCLWWFGLIWFWLSWVRCLCEGLGVDFFFMMKMVSLFVLMVSLWFMCLMIWWMVFWLKCLIENLFFVKWNFKFIMLRVSLVWFIIFGFCGMRWVGFVRWFCCY